MFIDFLDQDKKVFKKLLKFHQINIDAIEIQDDTGAVLDVYVIKDWLNENDQDSWVDAIFALWFINEFLD